jgi:hypothetical protein
MVIWHEPYTYTLDKEYLYCDCTILLLPCTDSHFPVLGLGEERFCCYTCNIRNIRNIRPSTSMLDCVRVEENRYYSYKCGTCYSLT